MLDENGQEVYIDISKVPDYVWMNLGRAALMGVRRQMAEEEAAKKKAMAQEKEKGAAV